MSLCVNEVVRKTKTKEFGMKKTELVFGNKMGVVTINSVMSREQEEANVCEIFRNNQETERIVASRNSDLYLKSYIRG